MDNEHENEVSKKDLFRLIDALQVAADRYIETLDKIDKLRIEDEINKKIDLVNNEKM